MDMQGRSRIHSVRGEGLRRTFGAILLFFSFTEVSWAAAEPAAIITKAYEYGLPAFEKARLAYNYSYNPNNPNRVPINSFGHRRALADYKARVLTTPNNDTLYSSAILDLSAGPVTLKVPSFGTRYYSIAFIDSYTNDFAYVGTRTNDQEGGTFLIAGPGWKGHVPPGTRVISSAENHIVLLVRILVENPGDLPAIHQLQDGLSLSADAPAPLRTDLIRPVLGDAANFVDVLNQVLRDDPPPKADAEILKDLAAVGVGPGVDPTPAQRQLWKDHFVEAQAAVLEDSRQIGLNVEGWQYTPSDIGNFGRDYRTRAVIALQGIGANIPEELVYTLATEDRVGSKLDGDLRYKLHLPLDMPPVNGPWSLSIYEVLPKGGMFFGQNPIQRYALGSLTDGLVRNGDGSVDIAIQKDPPATGISNWLPIPAKNFALVMRAYLPKISLQTGNFHYPGLTRLEGQ